MNRIRPALPSSPYQTHALEKKFNILRLTIVRNLSCEGKNND